MAARRAYLRALREAEEICQDIARSYAEHKANATTDRARDLAHDSEWAAHVCAAHIAALRGPSR